jgi:UDP-N-acetylmuramyl tripeptide synthase
MTPPTGRPGTGTESHGFAAVRRSPGLRDRGAIVGARLMAAATRRAGGNATSLPGYVAQRLSPGLISRLASDLGGTVLVSGTNGKTSTAFFLAHLLRTAGRSVVTNRSGANLEQGVSSVLVRAAGPSGRLRDPGAVAVFEVDEAALPNVIGVLPPTVVVLTNLLRDQLDRFGETDHLVRLWTTMLRGLSPEVVVVFCADDPRLTALLRDRPGSLTYGLAAPDDAAAAIDITPDVSTCPVCSGPLTYRWTALGPLGAYACGACGFRRPLPDLLVRPSAGGLDGQTLEFETAEAPGGARVDVRFPGFGNAYNAAAAVAAATALGTDREEAVAALADVTTPFARFEELRIEGRRVFLSLVKNTASLSELTRVLHGAPVDTILFLFSDNFQDGRDVSWYWDTNPAPMVRDRAYVIAGRRAPDFALRLKYALGDGAAGIATRDLGLAGSPSEGLARAIEATPTGGTCFVISTYTPLLALRATLVAGGHLPPMPR